MDNTAEKKTVGADIQKATSLLNDARARAFRLGLKTKIQFPLADARKVEAEPEHITVRVWEEVGY